VAFTFLTKLELQAWLSSLDDLSETALERTGRAQRRRGRQWGGSREWPTRGL